SPEFFNAPTQPAPLNLLKPNAAEPPKPAATSVQWESVVSEPAPEPAAAAPEFEHPFATVSHDIAHDPELDEAVIAFANADFEQCEQSLSALTGSGGARTQHA